jgi:hypothetical protein
MGIDGFLAGAAVSFVGGFTSGLLGVSPEADLSCSRFCCSAPNSTWPRVFRSRHKFRRQASPAFGATGKAASALRRDGWRRSRSAS